MPGRPIPPELAGGVTFENAPERFAALRAALEADPKRLEAEMTPGTFGNPVPLGPRTPSGADRTEKLIRNAQTASGDWLKGFLAPKKDPVDAGIAAKEKHKQRTQESLNQDRFAKGLAKVNREEMQQVAREIGANNFSTGIAARRAKIQRKQTALATAQLGIAQTIDAMPDATEGDRDKRALTAIQLGRKIKGTI